MDKSLRKDLIWNLIGQFGFLFCLWLITVLTTNLISVEAQGILSLALVASNICMSFGNYYLRLQFASDINDRFSNDDYVWARFLMVGVSLLICLVYSLALQYPAYVIGCILLYYVYKACDLISDIYHGVLQRNGKLYIGGMTTVIRGVASVGVFALIAFLSRDLLWAVLGLAFTGIATAVVDALVTRKATGYALSFRAFSFPKILQLLKICFPLFLLLLLTNILPSLPRIFFEKIYDKEQLGYYASVANIAILLQAAASAVMYPLVSRISKYYKAGDTKGFLKSNGLIYAAFAVLGALACLAVHFLGDWALKLIYGEKIGPYTYIFIPAVLSALATALVTVTTQILAAMEKRFHTTIILGVGTAICAAVAYPLCLNAYMDGISWSLVISQSVTILLGIFIILKWRKGGDSTPETEKTEAKTSSPEGNDIES